MAVLRSGGPCIWVTWWTRLLVGENSCEWAAWFRAQHEGWSWAKAPSGFDLVGWQLAHTAGVNECRAEWEERGHRVYTENQNSFALRGRTATLGGKPDLVALKGESGTIIDVKTGSPSPAHSVQVMLYMYAVPRAMWSVSLEVTLPPCRLVVTLPEVLGDAVDEAGGLDGVLHCWYLSVLSPVIEP